MQDDDIDMTGTEDGDKAARLAANLRAFRAHWEACRAGTDVPRRASIDPREIAPLISNAFIAERVAPGVVRLRVAGTHLNDLMGMEARGMPLSSFVAPDDRDTFGRYLVDLFDGPSILRMTLRSRRALGRPALSGTMMMLPLRSDLGDVSRTLGCLVSHGPIGRPARRFAIAHAETLPIAAAPHADPVPPLRTIAGGGAPSEAQTRDRAHLRLVT